MFEFTEEEIQAEAIRIHSEQCAENCTLNASHHYGWRNLAKTLLESQRKEKND